MKLEQKIWLLGLATALIIGSFLFDMVAGLCVLGLITIGCALTFLLLN
jgi:hypothetical protein